MLAQYPYPEIRHFDERDGFILHDDISDVKVDRKGYVWIVSFSSITRYDGANFKEIDVNTASHASFIWFFETAKGDPFVIDRYGSVFFIEADTLKAYIYNDSIKKINYRNQIPNSIYIDKKDVLHITFPSTSYSIIEDHGISQPTEIKNYKAHSLYVILRDRGGPVITKGYTRNKAIREASNGINLLNVDELRETKKARNNYQIYLCNNSYELEDSVFINRKEFHKGAPHSTKYFVKLKEEGYLVSTGAGALIEIKKGKIAKKIHYPLSVIGLLLDKYNGLWISTIENGIHYYSDSKIERSNRIVFFKNATAKASAVDREGGVWIYTEKGGLNYMPNPKVQNFCEGNGFIFNDEVRAIELIEKELWIGKRQNSIAKIDIGNYKKKYFELVIEKHRSISQILNDPINHRTWIAQQGYLFYSVNSNKDTWKRHSFYPYPDGTRGLFYRTFRATSSINGTSLVGSIGGAVFSMKDTILNYMSSTFGTTILGTLLKGDSIWINSENGLYLQVGDSISHLGSQFSELSGPLEGFTYFGNQLWVSIPNKGVYTLTKTKLSPVKYNGDKLRDVRFVKRNKEELWILSSTANIKVKRGNDENILEAFRPLPKMAISQICNNEKTIYIGTKTKGAYAIEFETMEKDSLKQAPLYINYFKVNGEEYPLKYDSTYELSYLQNFFQISYHAISYRKEQLHYRYRMLGLSNKWENTEGEFLQYPNLGSGTYTFELQAAIGEQPWGETKRIKFEILPPFWRTYWFISLSILAIGLITYKTLHYRIKRENREKSLMISNLRAKQEALQARMDPHFVFNVVASVQYLVLNKENERANAFLNMFSKSMRNILSQTDENSLTLEKELQFLKEYLNMERFRMEEKFEYEIDEKAIQEHLNARIPSFLIQPFIENAIHHGFKNKEGKGKLEVIFTIEQNNLKVQIEDDGVGRTQANKYKDQQSNKEKSYGLKIIRERLALHNKRKAKRNIYIKDLYKGDSPSGTKVTIYIRLMD